MERLTNRLYYDFEKHYKSKEISLDKLTPIYNKLSELEDLEEEIGMDLITLLTALTKDYIYVKCPIFTGNEIAYCKVEKLKMYKTWDKIKEHRIEVRKCDWDKTPSYKGFDSTTFLLTEYGKTWALEREELE